MAKSSVIALTTKSKRLRASFQGSIQPLVSVVIPTKNRCELLEETLRSIKEQTFPNWEAIVVDDGSTDGTVKLVETLASADSRVKFVRRECDRAGASTCRNIGLSSAAGEYIIFLDSDDLLAPTCLEQRIAVIEQNPTVDFAVFPTKVFHEVPGDSQYFWNAFSDEDDLERFFRYDTPWCTFGPIWRKRSLERVGFWDERALSWQDWEFHVRALAEGLRYIKVPEPDSFCRESRPGAISHASKQRLYIANRRRVLLKMLTQVVSTLRARNELTPRRRRYLAAHFYRYAFCAGLSERKALTIWRRAKNSGAINLLEYLILVSCWRLLGRIPTRCVKWLFPEQRLIRVGTTFKKTTVPVLDGAGGKGTGNE
jgi:glycosyltransferase involved in cell wall biosynthesis